MAAAAVTVLAAPSGPKAGNAWAAAGDPTSVTQVCDDDGVGTAAQPAFEPAVGYVVVAVEVSGLDARCAGRHVTVALTDRSGAVSSQSEPVGIPPGGGSVTVPVPPLEVAALARVHTLVN
jgi:hypothetical protein